MTNTSISWVGQSSNPRLDRAFPSVLLATRVAWVACKQGGLNHYWPLPGQLNFIKVWLLGLTVANCHFENSFGSFFMLMSLLRVWLVGANSKRSLLWKSNMPLSVQGSITIPGIGGRFRFCLSWNDFFATFAFDCRLEWQWIRLWKMIAI